MLRTTPILTLLLEQLPIQSKMLGACQIITIDLDANYRFKIGNLNATFMAMLIIYLILSILPMLQMALITMNLLICILWFWKNLVNWFKN